MWSKVILYLIINLHFLKGEEIGESCVPNNNFPDGTCTLVTNCEPALRQIKIKRGHDLERCGFDGSIEIVCCPKTTDSRFGTSTTEKTSTNQRIADRECQKIIDSAIQPLDYHILGGETAALGEFPHMVALGYERNRGRGYTFECGGSIISPNYVLTASHCVDTIDEIEPTVVRTGVVELGGSSWDDETDVGVAQIIKHPKYTRREKYHDLALLRLNKSLVFSSNLNAACLQTSDQQPSLPLLITGWGQTSNTRDAKSTMLLKASVVAVTSEKCGESYTNWRKLPQGIVATQLCAGDPAGVKDTCQGDSGGPLQSVDQENVYRIVGITSFGRGCGSPIPGVYTRVAKYTSWIESVVWTQ